MSKLADKTDVGWVNPDEFMRYFAVARRIQETAEQPSEPVPEPHKPCNLDTDALAKWLRENCRC